MQEALSERIATDGPECREMKIAKFAKYVGAMSGPEGYLHRWTASRNKCVRVCSKVGSSPRSFGEPQDLRSAGSGFIGSGGPRRNNTQRGVAFVTTVGGWTFDAISTRMRMADTRIGLGIDVHGIRIISLALLFRVATWSSTSADGIAKIQAARDTKHVTLQELSTVWDETVLHRCIAYATMVAHQFVSPLDSSAENASLSNHIAL